MTHTPTPWEIVELEDEIAIIPSYRPTMFKIEKNGEECPIYNDICHVFPRKNGKKPSKANAAFIVKAVNNHEKLISHLENVLNAMGIEDGESDAEYSKRRNKAVEEAFDLLYSLAKAKGEA